MKKTLALVVALLMVVIAAVGCTQQPAETTPASQAPASQEPASQEPASQEPASQEPASQEPASQEPANPAAPLNVAVLIKATDSDFWQYTLVGAKNYAVEYPDRVVVKDYGPPSEADIDQQVQILDEIITGKPDGIVIASTSSDAANAGIEKAMDQGIPVVTIDNQVTTDKYVTHLATDNKAAGAAAAEMFVKTLKDRNVELKGKVGIISSMAGVQVLNDREDGFAEKMKELAPDIEVLEKQYADSDIARALELAENIYTANQSDLLGIFASNNQTGDGLARFMTERKLGDKLVCITFDSDAEEVEAIKNGAIVGTVVQDPYGMGYKGVDTIYEYIVNKKEFEKYYDTGATVVTKENIEDETVKGLLDPFSPKKF